MYTRSQLKSRINAGIQGKISMLVSSEDLINEAVRTTRNEIKMRSAKRRAELTPNLFSETYEYTCPTDLDAKTIIDIPAQATREDGEFQLVPPEQFRRDKQLGDIAIDDYNGQRILLINSQVTDQSINLFSTTSIDNWTLFGDGENVSLNSDDYIKPTGSIEFDISSAGGTTAGAYASGLDAVDLTDYIQHDSSLFVNIRLTSATNITNFVLRIGSDSSNYHTYTATTQNDGTAFQSGWNLLRFDLLSPTTTGSPNNEIVSYINVYMTKTAGKISESGYLINGFVVRKGKPHNIHYYSKYGWKNSGGSYIVNSTEDADTVVADEDEFDLIVYKGRILAAIELEFNEIQIARLEKQYKLAKEQYTLLNPSEDKVEISSYHRYA